MKKIILLFKLLLFLTQLVKMETLPAANTQFSLDLFKKISGGNAKGNVFYSPISISSALAMVSLGAKGNTAAQMFKVISHLCIFMASCFSFNLQDRSERCILHSFKCNSHSGI